MTWVVDTCVIIDVLRGDKSFSAASANVLDAKADDVLLIAPVTYVELAPSFNGSAEEEDAFLRELGIECECGSSIKAVRIAHRAWYEHVLRKRAGEEAKRPIADVLIGAYALQKGGLITRNEADFRSLYPDLPICNPMNLKV